MRGDRLPAAPPPRLGRMGVVEIVEYDPSWPGAFRDVAGQLREALGTRASRIDHIGSTSVTGLPAKDVIDVQVTVGAESDLMPIGETLARAGWHLSSRIGMDHDVPGWASPPGGARKVYLDEPDGQRPVHVHVRVQGQPNQRYALLFRDYLRAHTHSAAAYATLKKDLAEVLPDDPGRYADTKDAACDLIYFAAEAWAETVGWIAGPSDA